MIFFQVLSPRLAGFLVKLKLVEFFPTKAFKFLENVTNEIIARRKAKLDVRDDFIQSMIEHEEIPSDQSRSTVINQSDKEWNGPLKKSLTSNEILAQAIVFLAAGYDTTSTTLQFISYNLAKYQEVQDKLIEEIDDILKKHVI